MNQVYICWIKYVLFLHLDEYTFIIIWKARLKSRIIFLLRGVYTEKSSPQTWSVVMTFLSQWLALSHTIKSPMQVCGYTTCTFMLFPFPPALLNHLPARGGVPSSKITHRRIMPDGSQEQTWGHLGRENTLEGDMVSWQLCSLGSMDTSPHKDPE